MKHIKQLFLSWVFVSATVFAFAKSPSLTINHIPLDFKVLSFSLMPGDTAFISCDTSENISFINADGTKDLFNQSYIWVAPKKADIYTCQLIQGNTKYQLNFLVLKSMADIDNTPNNFKIGHYPSPYKNLPQYKSPMGMIEVTTENKDVYISEHFQLKDFLVKQASDYPKYVLITDKLIYKLELIYQKLEEEGFKNPHIHVMSGYRTPYYNARIGNGKSSRHVYGDAADIFIDNNHNGSMDDLNKDGKINKKDAMILADIVTKIDNDPHYKWLIGGMGIYGPNGVHHGFVHVDARGFKARW